MERSLLSGEANWRTAAGIFEVVIYRAEENSPRSNRRNMRVSTIAFANLKRRKGKTAFVVVGMAIGIGTAVALLSLSGSIKEEIGMQLDQFGANIVVVPQSNSLALDYGGINVSGVSFDVHQLRNEDARSILEIPYSNRLSIIAPKLLGAVRIDGREVLLAGVDFESEMKLKRWWNIVGETPDKDTDVVLGYEVARTLSLIDPRSNAESAPEAGMASTHKMSHPDNAITESFTINRRSVHIGEMEHRVAGVLMPTGGREDRMVFGALGHVQSLLGKPDQLSLIEVSALCTNCPVEDIVAQISERLPQAKVSAIQQSVRARVDTVDRLTRFSAVVSAVVLAVGALMIFTTMMGSVIERNKEIGVMRALGFRKSHIVKGLMIEVSVISVIGGLLGWAGGLGASRAVLPYFSETGIGLRVDPLLALLSLAAALCIGALSSVYPAIRASRLDPAESVRSI
jgi:putative ABC transport system permease protein